MLSIVAKEGGNVGVIHWVARKDDLNYVIKRGSHPPYIPILEFQEFTM